MLPDESDGFFQIGFLFKIIKKLLIAYCLQRGQMPEEVKRARFFEQTPTHHLIHSLVNAAVQFRSRPVHANIYRLKKTRRRSLPAKRRKRPARSSANRYGPYQPRRVVKVHLGEICGVGFLEFFLQRRQTLAFKKRYHTGADIFRHFRENVQSFTNRFYKKPRTARHHHTVVLLKQLLQQRQSIALKITHTVRLVNTKMVDKVMLYLRQFFGAGFGGADVHFAVKLPAVGRNDFCIEMQSCANGKVGFPACRCAAYYDQMLLFHTLLPYCSRENTQSPVSLLFCERLTTTTVMIYFAMRPFARFALKVFFKKITLSHTDRIPFDKPVVLASNHPTAFMEPCLLACFLNRSLYFLVRGDIFAKPLYAKILRAFHMLPMYRLKDRGYKFVKANFQTFDACFDALYEKKTIMILAEGNTKSEKRLRPLQKGTARLAFGAIDKNPDIEDVYVVPVGVNFTYADRFRAEVMIDFGHPISARSYYEAYSINSNEAIDAFTGELTQCMRQLLVHVDRAEDDALAERLLVMSRADRAMQLWRVTGGDPTFLEEEKAVAAFVSALPDISKKELEESTELYFSKLEKKRLSDRAVLEQRKNALSDTLLMSLGAPLFLVGYLANYLPARAAKAIADKKVSHIEFYAPVMLVIALVLFKLYYATVLTTSIIRFGWQSMLWITLMALAGYFAVLYRDAFQLWKHRHNWSKLSAAEKENMVALRSGIELMRQNAQ